ncbi:hypothetical protein MNBD_GAMMA08-122 [hydrothermal vent metagenome]|uniref:SHSP domain-containing protein n=1 Tax=hydrothermal vent metagenome TaxID=652676 RepID=A0A3B0XDQ5_9ZZZZ
MSMTQYNPWNLFDQLQHEMNRAQAYKAKNEDSAVISDWSPAVDIKEEDNQYLLIADIPGVNTNDIEILMEKNILTIKGERNSELKDEQDGFKRVERKHGVFCRSFTLPEGVNADAIKAKSDSGVLTVAIPKQETVLPRKITVN